MAISRLSIIKFLELLVAVVCVGLHYKSQTGDWNVDTLSAVAFGGFIIILVGGFAGYLISAPINKKIDIFYSLVGCAIFVAAGALNIKHYDNSWKGEHRDYGDLMIKCGSTWCKRRVQVRAGQLHVSEPTSMKMPLRHLSLQAGPLPHSLAICRGQNIVLTLQTQNEQTFDQWVKTIAIELIRQTPVDAIKYLDILTLGERVKVKPPPNSNCDSPEEVVETLLKKCQNTETYVPVKEKLCLFESLCKMGRKVRSSEDVSSKPFRKPEPKRAKSCHDLSNMNAVREICKYFESCANNT
ncbi:unnamed protein product [Ceutorhynchus assimilis]|uniref:Uncharacterized protein n=1 Tax=Ceutorhynchus assimilis TaxID=467358 RepID=A0A9P0GWX5_9CUCU|nr:unnamed protein product [Ceutorhynchus assimilis]